ncbi:MAG: hypothetical protein ACTSV1_04445 [Alphaproteobacteria bacterium]
MEIARSVHEGLSRATNIISEGAGSDPGLKGAALLLWSLSEHARKPERLQDFSVWLTDTTPDAFRWATDLLAVMDAPRPDLEAVEKVVESAVGTHGWGGSQTLDLVNLTIAHAGARCSRYAGSQYPLAIASLEEFNTVPTLSRKDVEADFTSICAEDEAADYYTATSATTTGRSLLVPHCMAENNTLSTYISATTANSGRQGDPFGMTLRLMPAGRLIGAPLGFGNTVLATYETNAVRENIWDLWDYIAGQVFVEFPSATGMLPIETIHATPAFGLILLTKYMLQRGLDPAESSVSKLLVTGSWIGPSTRRWLQESWDAELFTTYSCSELMGSAVECPDHPGRYHFGPNILPEVLGPGGVPVAEGEQGEIHLTGLYPFQRSAVFLRYQVGDWGRWRGGDRCTCGSMAPSLDVLGRNGNVLTITSSDGTLWPIPPIPVRNALDRFDCVPKIPRPQYKMWIEKGRKQCLRIDVECFALAGPAWRKRIRDDMAEAIVQEDPSIRSLVEAGEIDIRVELFFRSKLTNSTSVI